MKSYFLSARNAPLNKQTDNIFMTVAVFPELAITCDSVTLRVIPPTDYALLEEMIQTGALLTPNDTRTSRELKAAARSNVNDLKHAWKPRNFNKNKWDIALGIYHNDALIGRQGAIAKDFTIHREAITYSAIAKPYRGNGYGTLSRIAILNFLFSRHGLGAIHAYSYADDNNGASRRVSEKLGYIYEGTVPHPLNPELPPQAKYHMTWNLWHYLDLNSYGTSFTGTEKILTLMRIQ
jgi:RimJ/RimL family protein N-acetyltransferase